MGLTPDRSKPKWITKGSINDDHLVAEIEGLQPDLLVAYGCSLIRSRLLERFSRRFLDVHLGLSPYYRGSGTNFWPLVHGTPEFVGASFMYIDKGIDTGDLIHQIRARIFSGDTPHSIGNRLIADRVLIYREIIVRFDKLTTMPALPKPKKEYLTKRADFNAEAVHALYHAFDSG